MWREWTQNLRIECVRETRMGDGGVKACSKGEEVVGFDGGGGIQME